MNKSRLVVISLALVATACGPSQAEINTQVAQSVSASQTAAVTATFTPTATPTITPTPTPDPDVIVEAYIRKAGPDFLRAVEAIDGFFQTYFGDGFISYDLRKEVIANSERFQAHSFPSRVSAELDGFHSDANYMFLICPAVIDDIVYGSVALGIDQQTSYDIGDCYNKMTSALDKLESLMRKLGLLK